MNSLRDTMETVFAAAAFAEKNRPQEALEFLGEGAQQRSQAAVARPKAKNARPRPSLKA